MNVPKERTDSEETTQQKVKAFAELVRKSKHLVIYTGAGVSTAASIPDYRGSEGVWTLNAQGKRPEVKLCLEQAKPTFAHMALVALQQKDLLKFVISTNCDGLHLRSGIDPARFAEIHGNIYKEYCMDCSQEYLRPFDVRPKKIQFDKSNRKTGRLCERIDPVTNQPCLGKLRDSIINFGELLPAKEMEAAIQQSTQADYTLVIGSSMHVTSAAQLPGYSIANGGCFSICNLQPTPYDEDVTLSKGIRLFCKADEFMRLLMKELDIEVPEYYEEILTEEEMMRGIITDPEHGVLQKYNVHSMSDDGPPPPDVLNDQARF
uniref:protein acetyllysine N-acetyltransferase n=1 Tax=Vannella robusta TaxID=1487602 RepID=A0A7S4MIQ6_9EUKA|mmetsp:Transcript_23319/g.29724  ORF Transcript_23319/g.29724 Transcript_23319/m.29724 type:complete len:319 (+) Transcript_23319:56-1012(+)